MNYSNHNSNTVQISSHFFLTRLGKSYEKLYIKSDFPILSFERVFRLDDFQYRYKLCF